MNLSAKEVFKAMYTNPLQLFDVLVFVIPLTQMSCSIYLLKCWNSQNVNLLIHSQVFLCQMIMEYPLVLGRVVSSWRNAALSAEQLNIWSWLWPAGVISSSFRKSLYGARGCSDFQMVSATGKGRGCINTFVWFQPINSYADLKLVHLPRCAFSFGHNSKAEVRSTHKIWSCC